MCVCVCVGVHNREHTQPSFHGLFQCVQNLHGRREDGKEGRERREGGKEKVYLTPVYRVSGWSQAPPSHRRGRDEGLDRAEHVPVHSYAAERGRVVTTVPQQ